MGVEIKMKRIACVCGAAIASSTSIKYELDEFLEREKIDGVETFCCRFQDIERHIDTIDIIVSASKLFKPYPVPVITDVCYLMGMGCEETNWKIIQYLRNESEQ